jgi:hypothetical protein
MPEPNAAKFPQNLTPDDLPIPDSGVIARRQCSWSDLLRFAGPKSPRSGSSKARRRLRKAAMCDATQMERSPALRPSDRSDLANTWRSMNHKSALVITNDPMQPGLLSRLQRPRHRDRSPRRCGR